MSPRVAQVHADICGDCPTPCARQRDPSHYGDPCASCPLTPPLWGQWGCDPSVPPPSLPAPGGVTAPAGLRGPSDPPLTKGLLARVRTYRRSGVLVGVTGFLRRRTACSTCDRRRTLPTHPGLYGCGSCSTCTGGPERMLVASSTCSRARW